MAECASIVLAEQAGDVKVVMTGPEVQVGPFVLFSTGLGDAWLLSPEEDLALCLMWHGQVNKLQITETAHELHIGWDAAYELAGAFIKLDPVDDRISAQVIGGYPLDDVRDLIDRALSFEGKFAKVVPKKMPSTLLKQSSRTWSSKAGRKNACELRQVKGFATHHHATRCLDRSSTATTTTEDCGQKA